MPIIEKIPLQPDTSDQLLNLELGGNPYVIRVLWNERFKYFSFSIKTVDDEPILTNIKMVKNYPLMQRFRDTRLPPGDIYFIQERGKLNRPEYESIGRNEFNLYYYEPDFVPKLELTIASPVSLTLGSDWDAPNLIAWDGGGSLWDRINAI